MKKSSVLLLTGLLSACGSSETLSVAETVGRSVQAKADELSAEVNRRCTSLAGNGATIQFTADRLCTDCTADKSEQALDAADETYATLKAGMVSPGTLSLRATAPPGVTFPAGSNASVTLSADPENFTCTNGVCVLSNNSQNWHITIRTFLANALQEEESQGASIDNDPGSRQIYGITTVQAFNAIEVAFDRTGIYVDDLPSGATISMNGANYVEPSNVLVHEVCGDFDLTGLQ